MKVFGSLDPFKFWLSYSQVPALNCIIILLFLFVIYRAQISNGLWPTSPSNLIVTWTAIACMLYWDNKYVEPITSRLWTLGKLLYFDESYHLLLRVFFISLIAAVGFFIFLWYARQYALRILLSYRGWMCKCLQFIQRTSAISEGAFSPLQ